MENLNDIRRHFTSSAKTEGGRNVITAQDGRQLSGRWLLCESGTVTPSHDPRKGFAPVAGFPTDESGNSCNDRDYYRDFSAQEVTRNIARSYDARAIQSPVIVSPDGVVLSGNGRTMAGEIAADEGTDGAYIDYLTRFGQSYGFSPEQISLYRHPRLVFVLDENLPYTPATFALFNARETKGQSKTESAVKYGKLTDDATFGRIISVINGFDTLGDFYACTEAATRCINDLRNIGVVSSMSYAEMFDGDSISGSGKELLENVLIGKAFSSNPDCARMITAYKSLRRSVVFALSEIADNLTLGTDYSLQGELSEGISLAYDARQHGYKEGERVSEFALQADIFSGSTKFDYRNRAHLILADCLNSEKATMLKKVFAVYNKQAKEAASGQADMFCAGGVKTKAEILEEVKAIIATGTTKEQEKAVAEATRLRTSDNLFVPEELTKEVKKGSYVEYKTASGDTIVCQVANIKKSTAYLQGFGGMKLTAYTGKLKPTADHRMSLPIWLAPGCIVATERSYQRIASIEDNTVSFEWVNGGYFDVDLSIAIERFKPASVDVCGMKIDID